MIQLSTLQCICFSESQPLSVLEDITDHPKIYTCASAVKATVKTVSFTYNGTGIDSLTVVRAEPKLYSNQQPLWGVENLDNKRNVSEVKLLWGLVSDEYENHPNISTVRQESCEWSFKCSLVEISQD